MCTRVYWSIVQYRYGWRWAGFAPQRKDKEYQRVFELDALGHWLWTQPDTATGLIISHHESSRAPCVRQDPYLVSQVAPPRHGMSTTFHHKLCTTATHTSVVQSMPKAVAQFLSNARPRWYERCVARLRAPGTGTVSGFSLLLHIPTNTPSSKIIWGSGVKF